MRIGEVAERLGLNPRTIRFYESIGVLPEPRRTPKGYRDYDERTVERLEFIRLAQSLGLSLDDIREILAFRDRGQAPCPYVRSVIDREAAAIDRRIRELKRLRSDLRRLQRHMRDLPDDPSKGRICHILENNRIGATPR